MCVQAGSYTILLKNRHIDTHMEAKYKETKQPSTTNVGESTLNFNPKFAYVLLFTSKYGTNIST